MKRILWMALSIFFLIEAHGQVEATDRIVLINQQSYDGIILEQIPGERIALFRTLQKDTINIEMEEIARMIRIVPQNQEIKSESQGDKSISDNRIFEGFNTVPTYGMIHYMRGTGDFGMIGLGLSFGANFDFGLQVGASIQYIANQSERYEKISRRQHFPLGLDLRYVIKNSKNGRFSTLLAFSGGYDFTINGGYFDYSNQLNMELTNGYFFNPGVAFRANVLKNVGLMFDLGYMYGSAHLRNSASKELMQQVASHNLIFRGSIFF
jgi:hypothetical protein